MHKLMPVNIFNPHHCCCSQLHYLLPPHSRHHQLSPPLSLVPPLPRISPPLHPSPLHPRHPSPAPFPPPSSPLPPQLLQTPAASNHLLLPTRRLCPSLCHPILPCPNLCCCRRRHWSISDHPLCYQTNRETTFHPEMHLCGGVVSLLSPPLALVGHRDLSSTCLNASHGQSSLPQGRRCGHCVPDPTQACPYQAHPRGAAMSRPSLLLLLLLYPSDPHLSLCPWVCLYPRSRPFLELPIQHMRPAKLMAYQKHLGLYAHDHPDDHLVDLPAGHGHPVYDHLSCLCYDPVCPCPCHPSYHALDPYLDPSLSLCPSRGRWTSCRLAPSCRLFLFLALGFASAPDPCPPWLSPSGEAIPSWTHSWLFWLSCAEPSRPVSSPWEVGTLRRHQSHPLPPASSLVRLSVPWPCLPLSWSWPFLQLCLYHFFLPPWWFWFCPLWPCLPWPLLCCQL
mmetsp:Transcript_50715/g.118493  ORF Transcript_50715/g.118493 Transcript_50715/m.118493 type:complete len:449 (-) Transcript_50715:221-1567(-)